MATLWLKFSEEISLPAQLTPAEQEKLDDIYDAADADSIFRRAIALLGFPLAPGTLLRWHHGQPYINWSQLVETVSCGWIIAWPTPEGGFTYTPCNNMMKLFTLLKSQWKAERYIANAGKGEAAQRLDEKLVESTALGLALQAIMLRLPKHTPQEFAIWLQDPGKAPLTVRKTIVQVQSIQKRRTQLSSAWTQVFPPRREPAHVQDAPAFFWDEPPPEPAAAPDPIVGNPDVMEWQGLPVCAGQVSGVAVLMRSLESSLTALDPADFSILLFPRARPETVEAFEHASALLFAEGGALSHACTVAREQGIPCITGLGPEFLSAIETRLHHGKVWLAIDGATGIVKVIPTT